MTQVMPCVNPLLISSVRLAHSQVLASSSGVISGCTHFNSNIVNGSVTAVATAGRREFDLFEAFCADNSSIGNIANEYGINVCRLTLKTCNLSTKIGTKKALALIRANPGASMHSSLPCTPWSTWNHINAHKYGKSFIGKLEIRRNESLIMLNNFSL